MRRFPHALFLLSCRSEEDKWASVLSLGGQEVTRKSPTPLLRKAYLQLSRIVHPDRLQHFPQATQAFQVRQNVSLFSTGRFVIAGRVGRLRDQL